MSDKENNLININHLIGFGSIDATYNFFSIEENMDYTVKGQDLYEKDKRYYEFLINKYDNKNNYYSVTLEDYFSAGIESKEDYESRINNKYSNLYDIICHIYNYLKEKNKNEVKKTDLGKKDINLLLGNYFPLGKKGTSYCKYPTCINELFGIYCLEQFKEKVEEERKKIFTNFFSTNFFNNKKKYIFTFGMDQCDYKKFFEDNLDVTFLESKGIEFPNNNSRKCNVYWHARKDGTEIYCFYHPSRYLKIEQIKNLFPLKK